MATKAQRHKAKLLAKIYLCVLVSWRQKCFATVCTKKALPPEHYRIKRLLQLTVLGFYRNVGIDRLGPKEIPLSPDEIREIRLTTPSRRVTMHGIEIESQYH